jgi:hypothetical protein
MIRLTSPAYPRVVRAAAQRSMDPVPAPVRQAGADYYIARSQAMPRAGPVHPPRDARSLPAAVLRGVAAGSAARGRGG